MNREALLLLLLAATSHAQDLTPKAGPQRRPIAIHGATVHTIDRGVIRGGVVWFDKGVIRGVGTSEVGIPVEAQRIDAKGLHVYPGLIGANTQIGLREIGSVRATIDADEVGDITPEVRAAVAVNPDSTVIPVTRPSGVLTVAVVPGGGLVPGRASVMQLAGWTWEDMAIDPDFGVIVRWPSSSRRARRGRPGARPSLEQVDEQRRTIDQTFRRARAYLAARADDPDVATDIRAESLAPTLRGEKPVVLLADHLEQIQSAVTWAADIGLRAIVLGGRDAPLCVDLLRKHDVAVILNGTHRLPKRRDASYDEPFTLPSKLNDAGLRWCLASGESFYNERNLPYQAATAVAFGLPNEAALRAITLSAAEILGVGDKLGSVTEGKLATLIVTDGDPLELTTKVVYAFVSGRAVTLKNKHTQLAEKYREKYRQSRPR